MVRLKVKEVAKARGVSQRRLSLRSGIDINTIRRIFQNPTTANPTVGTLGKIADTLGVDVSELLESVLDGEKP
ncbi:MAG TPA: helix-turn-helix transcriptional regulator [Ktedonobacteraceae bacterium]|nr:helix-turn-helix transcriptional regulator [Ktedonobacteraceae bacterium]